MHVIAQCFAIGLGFATGLSIMGLVLANSGKSLTKHHHAELLEQYKRTEDRLEEYTRHMGVVAEAARLWISKEDLRVIRVEVVGEDGK